MDSELHEVDRIAVKGMLLLKRSISNGCTCVSRLRPQNQSDLIYCNGHSMHPAECVPVFFGAIRPRSAELSTTLIVARVLEILSLMPAWLSTILITFELISWPKFWIGKFDCLSIGPVRTVLGNKTKKPMISKAARLGELIDGMFGMEVLFVYKDQHLKRSVDNRVGKILPTPGHLVFRYRATHDIIT